MGIWDRHRHSTRSRTVSAGLCCAPCRSVAVGRPFRCSVFCAFRSRSAVLCCSPSFCSAVLFRRRAVLSRAGWVFRRWEGYVRRRACSMWLRAACSLSWGHSAVPVVPSSFRSRWSVCRRVPSCAFRLRCSVCVWLPVVLCARSCSRCGSAVLCAFLSRRLAVCDVRCKGPRR
jgi:hypothetical protein